MPPPPPVVPAETLSPGAAPTSNPRVTRWRGAPFGTAWAPRPGESGEGAAAGAAGELPEVVLAAPHSVEEGAEEERRRRG